MRFRRMSLMLLSVTLLTSISSAKVWATDIASILPPRITWSTGLDINVCLPKISGPDSCGSSKMPSTVGQIRKVIPGNFLSLQGASWLAIADHHIRLCGFSSNSSHIVCQTVKARPEFIEYNINYLNGALHISPKSSDDESSQRTAVFADQFSTAVSNAAVKLQGHLAPQAKKAPTGKQADARPVRHANAICEDYGEDGDCIGDGGNGSGGDDGGGDWGSPDAPGEPGSGTPDTPDPVGYDDSTAYGLAKCVPGPIIVCVTRPPPPIDELPTLPTAPITLCGTFGLFCDEPAPPVASVPDKSGRGQAEATCLSNYNTQMTYCDGFYKIRGVRWWKACTGDAAEAFASCLTEARKLVYP